MRPSNLYFALPVLKTFSHLALHLHAGLELRYRDALSCAHSSVSIFAWPRDDKSPATIPRKASSLLPLLLPALQVMYLRQSRRLDL